MAHRIRVLLGVIVAATDPVAVIALFRDLGIKGRTKLLVESESLFNDGVAAVLFGLALTLTSGKSSGVIEEPICCFQCRAEESWWEWRLAQ